LQQWNGIRRRLDQWIVMDTREIIKASYQQGIAPNDN
jgi:hypothetical protein